MLLHFIDYRMCHITFVKSIHALLGNTQQHLGKLWIAQDMPNWMWRTMRLKKIGVRSWV